MWHAWKRGESSTGFWWKSPKEKDHLEDPAYSWEDGIKMDLREIGWGVWNGFIWLRIGIVNAMMNLQVLVPRS
jgi:hypothetical protein